jgi:hypothetical protein
LQEIRAELAEIRRTLADCRTASGPLRLSVPEVIRELLNLIGPLWKLAEALGVSQGTISKRVRGPQEPSMSQWQRMEGCVLRPKATK